MNHPTQLRQEQKMGNEFYFLLFIERECLCLNLNEDMGPVVGPGREIKLHHSPGTLCPQNFGGIAPSL